MKYLTLLSLLFSLESIGQNREFIKGKIIDAETSVPIHNAKIITQKTQVLSDNFGGF